MNRDKLQKNMMFKSYRSLCAFLGEEIKGGDSKKSQIKEWERYFQFHKDGNKFIIDEVYDEPREKEDGRVGAGVFSSQIQILLLNLLVESNEIEVNLSCTKLLTELKMVNDNYVLALNNTKNFSDLIKINENICYDVINFEQKKLRNNLENALNGLANKGLIRYTKRDMVHCEKIENENIICFDRLATKEEIAFLLKCQKDALNELGLETISQIYEKNLYQYFNILVKRNIKNNKHNTDIVYGFVVYNIIQLQDFVKYELEKEEKKLREQGLNYELLLSAYKSIKKKHENTFNYDECGEFWGIKSLTSNKLIMRNNKGYIENANKVAKSIIDITENKI